MPVSALSKIFVFALCLTAMGLPCANTARAETELSPKVKQELQAAVQGAKPVPVKVGTTPPISPAGFKNIDAVDEKDIEDVDPLPGPAPDAEETAPLRVSLDKPEIVRLDRDAVNVIVGSNDNLRVVPDTNKSLVLIAKKPGSTYFRALDIDGKVIMQRHVIIGSPTKNYIRIRRACANGANGCKQYSVYYCPDMCHEVSVAQDATSGSVAAIPAETPSGSSAGNTGAPPSDSASETPHTSEPPPGE